MISVGVPVEQLSTSRAELNIITLTNNPCDIWMGSNNQRYWSITARDSTENYQLGIYNSKVSSWNAIFRDNINDFYVKTKVRDTFLVLPTTGGGYNEGIRIGNASNGWSNIQYGYGYINYIHPDLIALSIGAIQEIISEEYTIKKDIDSLKNRVRQLEAENKQLKERLGLIA